MKGIIEGNTHGFISTDLVQSWYGWSFSNLKILDCDLKEYAVPASNASWYQLAIFESDFQKSNSKCLLGKSQTLSDLHRSGAGCTFLRNASVACQCTLYLKNQDAF